MPSDDVSYRPHGTESLDPEETRESSDEPKGSLGLRHGSRRSGLVDGQFLDDNVEPVARKATDLEGAIGAEGVQDFDVLQVKLSGRLNRNAFDGEQRSCHRVLVLRVRDAEPATAVVHRAGQFSV